MLTGVQIIFLGGDARQVEVIRKCSEMDATVSVVGFDNLKQKLQGVTRDHLTAELLAAADVLVLPVVGCDDQGMIHTQFSNDPLKLQDEHMASLRKGCRVYTGMAKPYLRSLCAHHEIKLVELLDRDEVAISNSIPTAEGALVMAIQNTDFTIHGSDCMVLGLGRTGFTMAKTLQGLGAKVKVGVRAEKDIARAEVMGWEPFLTRDLADHVSNIDLIFNTIPTMIVTAQILSKMPLSSVIIDLASAPGGCDFRYAEKRGIKALLAPGLPGIVAPKTAGLIIASSLVQLISDEFKTRGDGE